MNDELEFEKEFPSFFEELDLNELSEERCMCGYVIGSNEIDMTNGYFKCPRCQEENAFQSYGVDLYAKHNVKSYLKNHCIDKQFLKDTISEIFTEFIDMYAKEYHNPIRCFNSELYKRLKLKSD